MFFMLGSIFFFLTFASAQPLPLVTSAEADAALKAVAQAKPMSRSERIFAASALFLGTPYVGGGSTGEGINGDYDQDPIISFKGFDCTTYIEAAIALGETASLSLDSIPTKLSVFLDTAVRIKYRDGSSVSFVNRSHFVEVDWLPALQRLGLLGDLSSKLEAEFNVLEQPISIDRYGWGIAKTKNDLRIYTSPNATEAELNARLGSLHFDFQNEGSEPVPSVIKVVPLNVMASNEFERKLTEILKTKKILQFQLLAAKSPAFGLMVTHQGFIVLNENGTATIRHASPGSKAVVDVPFHDYVLSRQTDKLTKLGFNIQEFLD
jgi:hypothetical protein